jgi:hypothetical protein
MKYLIWSEEHQAWWKPGKTGYTRSIFKAGRYEQPEAVEIVKSGNQYLDPTCDPPLNEVAIPDPIDEFFLNR